MTITMLARCLRRLQALRQLRMESRLSDAQRQELERAIRSLEAGYDPPITEAECNK